MLQTLNLNSLGAMLPHNSLRRVLIGVFGGLVASASKILALDRAELNRFTLTGDLEGLDSLRTTLLVITPILMFLGAVIAWASAEENRMKLLAIGASAPALVTPWTAQQAISLPLAEQQRAAYHLISSAHAAEENATTGDGYLSGLKVLFGITDLREQKYWAIVGSRKDRTDATKYAEELNRSDPELKAFVGLRKPENPYYPIIVGGAKSYLKLDDAKVLLERAKSNALVPPDAYLSNYPTRLPTAPAE